MDTRTKIVSPHKAADISRRLQAQSGRLTVVTGTFDVLLAAHARALGDVRNSTAPSTLMVVLLPSPGAFLADRARAELVAALSMVDYVIIGVEGGVDSLLESLGPHALVRRQAQDAHVQRQLIAHVQSRHSG